MSTVSIDFFFALCEHHQLSGVQALVLTSGNEGGESRMVVLTHFFALLARKGEWVELTGVVRDSSTCNYAIIGPRGTRPISEYDVKEREAWGAIITLLTPTLFSSDHHLWVTDDGSVWVAREPKSSPDRLQIAQMVPSR